jgi:hypothetical protein
VNSSKAQNHQCRCSSWCTPINMGRIHSPVVVPIITLSRCHEHNETVHPKAQNAQYSGSTSSPASFAFARFGLAAAPPFFFRVTLMGAGALTRSSSTTYSGKPDGVRGVPTSAGVPRPLARGEGTGGETAFRGISPTRSTSNAAGVCADGARRSGVRAGVRAGEGKSSSRTMGIASTSCPFAADAAGRSLM